MTSIPGPAYLTVGAIIAGYSRFILGRGDNAAMTLFFWIGIVLVTIGVFKTLITYVFGKKERKTEENQVNTKPKERSSPFHCLKCNAKLHEKSRYCNWCGTKQ